MTTQPRPSEELEGISLLAELSDLLPALEAKGWRHNARPDLYKDQRIVVFPGDDSPVERFKIAAELGVVIVITAEYRRPEPTRVDALKRRFPVAKAYAGGWNLTDLDHQYLANVTDDGAEVNLMHAGKARDQREVRAMLRQIIE